MRTEPSTLHTARRSTLEPSRAWILGLVVDADGSLTDVPPAEPEWPVTPRRDARPDQILSQDGPSVRP